jgi:hypothetical protein|tara:strand:+ start:709 stop:918 length:210 start_codon:yes stop_codon:yes gene_type:complete
MNEWILFTIGIFIGNMLGITLMALLSVNRYSDMSREIQDLRIQRKLLKEEILKKQAKPKPRKFRKKKNV